MLVKYMIVGCSFSNPSYTPYPILLNVTPYGSIFTCEQYLRFLLLVRVKQIYKHCWLLYYSYDHDKMLVFQGTVL